MSEHEQATDVFHYAGLTYWGPISEATVESVLDLIEPPAGGRALDIGCGRGELMSRLVERFALAVTGVDFSAAALAQAREQLASRSPGAVVDLQQSDVSEVDFDQGSFDVVSWLGGPYLGEDFSSTITQLAAWTRPGGYVLIGHGFWSSPPNSEYLSATGIDAGEFGEHWENIEIGAAAGLIPLHSCQSSLHEWDAFEGRIMRNVEVYAAQHPDNPDPQGRLEKRRDWTRAQQRWGRNAMGFGLYLFLR